MMEELTERNKNNKLHWIQLNYWYWRLNKNKGILFSVDRWNIVAIVNCLTVAFGQRNYFLSADVGAAQINAWQRITTTATTTTTTKKKRENNQTNWNLERIHLEIYPATGKYKFYFWQRALVTFWLCNQMMICYWW